MLTTLLMTPAHPRWDEFCTRLGGPEGCGFRHGGAGDANWTCHGDAGQNPHAPELVHALSRAILTKMGLSHEAIAASIAFFEEHGGYCDCEVLLNVDPDPPRQEAA